MQKENPASLLDRNIDFQSVCPAGLQPAEGDSQTDKMSAGRTG